MKLFQLPLEVLLIIVRYINLEDFVSLSRTSTQLQDLLRGNSICKMVLEDKLPFCVELAAASGQYASAIRRVAKRHEAIASASPFCVAIVGLGDYFFYCHGILCNILEGTLRILNLHKSEDEEVVVLVPALLKHSLPTPVQHCQGRFEVLYCRENIVSCLYRLNHAHELAYLIVFNTQDGKILISYGLSSTEKFFVRHNSQFLYYGTHSWENSHGRKEWVVRAYSFEKQDWLKDRLILSLNGSVIGSSICFEILHGHFYTVSNKTNAKFEEVDWTSFYHGIRFPVGHSSKEFEKTNLDKHIWRRQHREGPIDDRWTKLSLEIDKATNDVNIVEARREIKSGLTSQRTFYITKLVFSQSRSDEMVKNSGRPGQIDPSWKHTLAALTNDRLALTLKPGDNPHWFAPQPRSPTNVHPGNDGFSICSKTHLQYYNQSAQAFLDLVDVSNRPDKNRLMLRVGSRKLDPSAKDDRGIIIPGDIFKARPESSWPSRQNIPGITDEQLEELFALMSPPGYSGQIQVVGDDRSFVYAIGESRDGQLKAMVFVSFDPATHLKGLKRWHNQGTKDIAWNCNIEEIRTEKVLNEWMFKAPAMYLAIGKGYNFGLKRKGKTNTGKKSGL